MHHLKQLRLYLSHLPRNINQTHKFSNQSFICSSRPHTTSNMTEKPTILVTYHDISKTAINLMKDHVNLIFNDEKPFPTHAQIKAKVKDVDGIFFASKYRLDKEIIDAAGPRLKFVAIMSAGTNHIDVEYLKLKKIKLANTPEVVNDSTANTAILLALAASRRITEGRELILNEAWLNFPQLLLGQEISESTVGIVGLGGIGQTIAKRLKAFDVCKILYSGNKEKPEGKKLGATFVNLDTLLTQSDFIFAVCPLTDKTRGMFNKEAFDKMKKTCVFVNISRGQVVVQEDLIEALKNKVIFAAGLDVMMPEPLPKDHPLLSLSNCIITPHIGTATDKAREKMAVLTAQNILRAGNGEEMITPVF